MDISAYQHMNIRMSTRGKRPLRNLTPNDKVRAIQRIHNGETKASVSRDIGVPESTLRGWCKNEQKLRFMCRQLGSDNLGLANLATPPEKRSKFDLQLLPPKFPAMPSFDDVGFASMSFPSVDYTSQNDAIFEKFALVDFLKRNGLHTEEEMQQLSDIQSGSTHSVSPISSYSTNNVVHQLNLLALFNSKLPPKSDHITAAAIPNLKTDNTIPSSALNEPKNYNCPLLSVKNWAKDPSAQTQYINDKNNNDIDGFTPITPTSDIGGQSSQISGESSSLAQPMLEKRSTQGTDADYSGGALLDWCKIFSASLNFFAFAAAAASIQPGVGVDPTTILASPKIDDMHDINDSLLKRLSPSVHSESSKESYYDSEPEDLSVRSCASKLSSPTNSRSQSPDKSSASTSSISIKSCGDQ